MAKTVLIYASVPIWEYHHAESVELALSHIAHGDDVHVLTCRGALHSCAANANHLPPLCDLCIEQQRRTKKILGKSVTWHTVSLDSGLDTSLPRFSSITALREFKIDEVPHGAFVTSQLVDNIRDGYPELEKHAAECDQLLRQSVALYNYAANLIAQIGAEHVYVWNGRRPSDGPVIWAARKFNVPFTSHIWDYDEPWGFTKGFIAIQDATFHDLTRITNAVRVNRNGQPLTVNQQQQALAYLESVTTAGRRMFGANFRDDPLHFLLPDVRKIGIFTTSEWEIAGEPTWENHIYPSQWAGIEQLITDDRLRVGTQFIVRLHPNLVNSPRDSGEWKTIRAAQATAGPQVHFVQPEDPVDSYRLLEACDTVVTFGSTVGIEASWRGKPVVLLSRAPYEGAGICYEPQSHEVAVRLIAAKLEPMPKENVLRYAYRRAGGIWDRIQLQHLRMEDNTVWFRNYRLFLPSANVRLRGFISRLVRRCMRSVASAFGDSSSRNA